jgi:translation initiation factor IF-3
LAKIVVKKRTNAPSNIALINENIKAEEVRLIGEDGQTVGVVKIREALNMAAAANLDLVVVAEESSPPVCKILNYGKYRYDLQKKKTEDKKKQKIVGIKEVQLRPFIGENDLLIKCKSIKRFIESGNKVKLALRFRGRELSRQELGFEIVKKVLDFCQDFAKEENSPKLEGSMILTILTGK